MFFFINARKYNYNLEFKNNHFENEYKNSAPLIDYLKTLGVFVPHFCYHKNLSVSGNCRMCLVEFKKLPKPIVSCAMNAKSSLSSNTQIFTKSPLVKKSRENVLEFLLLNHPLDCPICDQGGQCDLQEQSLFFGLTKKRFYNFKRITVDKNIGPVVKTIMTRCIHCTRCVRFAAEVSGVGTLGTFGRGLNTEIGTFVTKSFESEFSNNIIDLCPVGALTAKSYSLSNRSWELKYFKSIDCFDEFGTNILVFLKNNKIAKIMPSYSSSWITNKTRFAFTGLFSNQRLLTGLLIKTFDKTLQHLNWSHLFKELACIFYFQDHLNRHFFVLNKLILLISNHLTLESLSFLKLLAKKFNFLTLKTNLLVTSKNEFEADYSLKNLKMESFDFCLLIGLNIKNENPYLQLKIRKRYLQGNFKIFILNSFNNLKYLKFYTNPSLKTLTNLVEGNLPGCQFLKITKAPLTLINNTTFAKQNSVLINNFIQMLITTAVPKLQFSFLNNFFNISSIPHLCKDYSLKTKDLNNFSGVLFVNFTIRVLNKFIQLKLLNYLKLNNLFKTFIQLNNSTHYESYRNFNSKLKLLNYFYLPNSVFFESTGVYLNVEGIFKKSMKLLPLTQNAKNNWQIFRRLNHHFEKIEFLANPSFNTKVVFNSRRMHFFKNFISFLNFSNYLISPTSFYLLVQTKIYDFTSVKFNKAKVATQNFKFRNLFNDSYLNNFDLNSNFSIVMIECSYSNRLNEKNFSLHNGLFYV